MKNGNAARLDALARNGVVKDIQTGKEYFSGYVYKTLYDWDQYFEAIIQLYLGWDTKYIENGITLFLDNQRPDGFIARTVPVRPVAEEGSEHVKPFLSQIALLLLKKNRELPWLNDHYFERIRKYLLYWLNEQDRDKNNLSVWNSAPHSGMDNQHERAGWWMDCFCEGVDLNSYLYRECMAFSEICRFFGKNDDAERFYETSERIKAAVREKLWDDEDGFFYDRNEITGEKIKIKSSSSFAALWAEIATQEQAERMINEHLLNPREFWRPFPIPSLAASEKGYSESFLPGDLGCSWRANTWIPVNYYTMHGLLYYGYKKPAMELAAKTFTMVNEIGDREYYTSESCRGCGLDPFWGWSLLAYFMPFEAESGYDLSKMKG